jgi:iron complex transport system substrate-binding protein
VIATERTAPVVRVVAVLLLVAVVLAAVAGCATGGTEPGTAVGTVDATDTAPAEPQLPATVHSADGREVTVTDASRLIPLAGSISETLFALGLGDRVVARDISATFAEAADLPLVTRSHDVSPEAVLSLAPTLVLAQTDTGPPEALDQIRQAGVPVLVLDQLGGLDDLPTRVRTVAAAVGLPQAGEALVQRTDEGIAQAQATIPADASRPKVAFLYMRGQAGVYLIGGKGSGADSMIEAAGATDAGTALGLDRPFTSLTSEALVGAAPDVILMTTTGLESVGGIDGLLQVPGIAETPAGRDRRIITEEDGLLYSFGPRTPTALADLIAELYATPSPSS